MTVTESTERPERRRSDRRRSAPAAGIWPDGDLLAWIAGAVGGERVLSDTAHSGFSLDGAVDVPRLIAAQTSGRDWLSLVRAGSVLDPQAWTLAEGSPDPRVVEGAYRAGYSLVMRRMHLRSPEIRRLARRLDRMLIAAGHVPRRATRSNLFASPAGSQGLAMHHDDHDVAVLQVSGSKRWDVHAPVYRRALTRPDRHLGPADCESLLFSGTLHPGSVLFVPRGFPHIAHTDDTASVHITLGVELHTWLDLVQAAAVYSEPLRHNVPPVPGGLGAEAMDRGLVPDMHALRRGLADLSERMLRGAGLTPGRSDWDRAEAAVTPTTRLCRTESALSILTELGEGHVSLSMQGFRLDSGPASQELPRFLHRNPEFTVRDLPGLDEVEALALASRLVADGLLTVADDPVTARPESGAAR